MILAEASEILPLLSVMELDFDRLIEVARYADRERAFCTANDPKGFDLITMNAKVARGLREMMCGNGWESDETDNQPGIKNQNLKIRIIPCNFDQNAGDRLVDPTNRAEKGAASKTKVRCNATAWIPGLPDPTQDEGEGDYATFVFGTCFEADGGLRAELSKTQGLFFWTLHEI